MTQQEITFGPWRKGSRSTGGGNCVEVAWASQRLVGVRDSKKPEVPPLVFTPAAAAALYAMVAED